MNWIMTQSGRSFWTNSLSLCRNEVRDTVVLIYASVNQENSLNYSIFVAFVSAH